MFILFIVVAPAPNGKLGVWLMPNKYLSNLSVDKGLSLRKVFFLADSFVLGLYFILFIFLFNKYLTSTICQKSTKIKIVSDFK